LRAPIPGGQLFEKGPAWRLANPAAALGRVFSDTFRDVPAFVVAEVLGGSLAVLVARGFAAVR